MKKRDYLILISLSILVLLANIHKYFIGTDIRWNPFLFYDYITINCEGEKVVGKLVSGIMNDFSNMVSVIVVLLIAKSLAVTRISKNVISPFLWIAFLDIIDYFCVYKQLSYYKLPLLVVLVFIYNWGWIKKDLWTKS